MLRYLPLLLLAALAAEIASIIWVGSLIGVIPTLLLMFLGGFVGVRLIRTAGTSLADALRSPVQPASPLRNLGGRAAAQSLSGLLFLLPGFFSDLLGLLLFLPAARRWMGMMFRVDTHTMRAAPPDQGFGQVIDVETVEIAGEIDRKGPQR